MPTPEDFGLSGATPSDPRPLPRTAAPSPVASAHAVAGSAAGELFEAYIASRPARPTAPPAEQLELPTPDDWFDARQLLLFGADGRPEGGAD